jgi:HJR/Mrr/RecB family endonuclease
MFCPQCKAEFKEGVTRCPECDVTLVDQLDAEAEYEFGDFVTIYQTANPGMLSIAKSILDNADIYFATKGEAFEEVFKSGTVELQVLREEASAAAELLNDLQEMTSDELEASS